METVIPLRKKLIKAINELPAEALPEPVNFIDYLRFKVSSPIVSVETQTQAGSEFLLSIAGLGASEEDDKLQPRSQYRPYHQ